MKVFRYFLLAGMIHLPAIANAQSVAKYSNEFLSIGVGSRALGMGGAFTALSDDISAAYWNPAGLSSIVHPGLILMHASNFSGIVNYDYAGFGMPLSDHNTFAISIIRLGIDDIPITDIPDPERNPDYDNRPFVVSYINNSEYALFFSYAKQKGERFSYGGNVKLLQKGVGDFSAFGLGFDIGFMYNPDNALRLGMNITDVTSTLVVWNTDAGTKELALPTVKLGAALDLEFPIGRILPALAVDTRFEGREYAADASVGEISFNFRMGFEYTYHDRIALRAGVDDIGQPTVGTGFFWQRFNFDYSFGSFNNIEQLGNSHRITLQYRWID